MMRREDIESELHREPFIPLRLHLINGKKLDVPFQHVAVFQKTRMIVFKGVKKSGSHIATGYEVIGFDQIDSIEKRQSRGGKRRKAS